MKLNKLLGTGLGVVLALSASASDLNEARIYINPGHGGWGPNDRPMATINYAQLDTLGFFETNTNLVKALSLKDELEKAGVGYVRMSRTVNGVVAEGDKNRTENDQYTETQPGESGTQQLVTLSVITQDVEANNMDYFISIHSNAATEGTSTNYPLLLYRGTDNASGNGLTNAREMALDAWQYVNKNDITYKSAYTSETSNNSRGDISFYGSSSANSMGYTGYLGVLKHGCDGFLSEGCFHTYQPERQRLLNKDYCKQEGVRYARAIRAWFGDNSETQGCIMGTVKDKYNSLENDLYNYKVNSVDAYAPLNNVTVVLQDADGQEVARYTTDNEYNGVFVFTDLEPGTYNLVFDIEGFWPETEPIEVVANETAFINQRLTDLEHEEPSDEEVVEEVLDYPHPEQDGDIAAAGYYNFTKDLELNDVAALEGLTVRRAILRDNKYYVLAVDADKAPKLMVLDPATGALIKEMSTEGIVTEGYNGKTMPYVLSDIGFTTDGALIGTNSTIIGKEDNAYQTGDFYVYKWQGDDTTPLEDTTPVVLATLPTNTSNSLAAAGNNNSNFIANTIAVSGSSDEFQLYFDSHPGNDWTTDYDMRYLCWNFKNGEWIGFQKNNADFTAPQIGEAAQIVLSPLAKSRFIIDGTITKPQEFIIDWMSETGVILAEFSEDIPVESKGANYFRYADKIYMSAPVCEENEGTYSYKVRLYDVTNGIDHAQNVGDTEAAITSSELLPMSSAGVVDNADIDLYLMVGNDVVRYTTKGVEQAASPARIYAYDLSYTESESSYTIHFKLNEDATAVDLLLTNPESGETVETISLGALEKGENETTISRTELPAEQLNWSIKATADNVTRFTKVSDDSALYQYYAPYGVAIDKSPESDYFGRIYVTNTAAGTVSAGNPAQAQTSSVGVYVLGADISDITNQGSTAYKGTISWSGSTGMGPRKAAVAADGRVFLCDASADNAGIYYMDPETFEITTLFPGATNNAGSLSIDGTYVCGQITAVGVRGEGASTQLYAIDKTASGSSWKKFVNVYNIGESNTWTAAPNESKAASSYVGNDNSSVVPVSTGYWAASFRGAGSNSTANPCMFYYSDQYGDAVFNSAEPNIISESSQNGALAVNEKESLVALSVNGGVGIYSYKMKEGIPEVTEEFKIVMPEMGGYVNDFEFDYAGNLYAVSNAGERLSVWAMPTSDNSCITPAKKSLVLNSVYTGIENTAVVTRIAPNPTTGLIHISAAAEIETVEVYNIAGAQVMRVANVGANTVSIDLADLASGIYFVKVNNGKAVKVIKR